MSSRETRFQTAAVPRGQRSASFRMMVGLMLTSLIASSCQDSNLINIPLDGIGENGAAVAQPTVQDLAAELDTLEHNIELYGSIVAEQPSVWGQARLTMYREEFEKTMQAELTQFHATLQGSLSRSDQAYAADALALSYTAQAAAAGNLGGTSSSKKGASTASSSSSSSSSGGGSSGGGGGGGGGGSGSSGGGTSGSPSGSSGDTGSSGAFDGFNSITRNPARMASPLGFAGAAGSGSGGISLEPTVYLDQMKRYIDHLHELRRMSDGDDTADAPGYSLNLVRIPISVLPGRQTQQRYGAEITFTLRPHLHDELLPMTFRNLVVNDLIDQVGVPLTQTLNDQQWQRAMTEVWGSIEELSRWSGTASDKDVRQQFVNRIAEAMDVNYACQPAASPVPDSTQGLSSARMTKALAHYKELQHRAQYLAVQSSTRLRTANRPFPPSQLVDIYGPHGWAEIVCTAWLVFNADAPNKEVIHYPDVQNYLQEELSAAYAFLKTPDARPFWEFCAPELANDVHGRRIGAIYTKRCDFERNALAVASAGSKATPNPGVTTALSWAILVDSALLNQQLIEDMKQAPVARGNNFVPPSFPPDKYPQYFLPDPGKAEREAFNEYVHCRWPLHVFALDPEADQENIADSYSSRREMQLAMSLAFVSGNLSASNMFRYARRLETDMETIALNNTAVGFSHGTETFGWRFYPRYQTPDTPSNLHAFLQDTFCGGPSAKTLLKHRELDPGIRECVAIVLMPSFVPYADLDASSNWFALDNPRRKVMTSQAAIQLGEQLKFIQNCSRTGPVDVQCTRDGDLERLMTRADQLESRLPLQSMSVQVPYENTLGGFAMFSTGVTDLAPELFGWYGAPAINLDAPTTIFLIGNHFSVHQTRVIIGGQEITNAEMLSRQVMKVTIPPGAIGIVEKTGSIAGGWRAPTVPSNLPNAQTKSPSALEDREANAAGQSALSSTGSSSVAPAGAVPFPTADPGQTQSETPGRSRVESMSLTQDSAAPVPVTNAAETSAMPSSESPTSQSPPSETPLPTPAPSSTSSPGPIESAAVPTEGASSATSGAPSASVPTTSSASTTTTTTTTATPTSSSSASSATTSAPASTSPASTPPAASSTAASSATPAAPSTPPTPSGPTTISAPSAALLNLGRAQILTFSSSADHENAITLGDPQTNAPDEKLTLTVGHGALTLGMTGALTFVSGSNGAATFTVQGKLPDLNQALEGLTYVPTAGFSGADTLTISFTGKGTPSSCLASVAIAVNAAWPDYIFVDVQLATPYGTTSHLLVPAWHLGKDGSGSLPVAQTNPTSTSTTTAGTGSTTTSQPDWMTATWLVDYVSKGTGIALAQPAVFAPTALTLNLGANYQIPSDGNVSLKMSLAGKTSAALPTLTIAVKSTTPGTSLATPSSTAGTSAMATGNYDATNHLLTIAGTDLNNLATDLFNVIGTQYGSANPVSSTNNTLSIATTVSGMGQTDVKVGNALTVTLSAAAPQPGQSSTASTTPGTSTTSGASTTPKTPSTSSTGSTSSTPSTPTASRSSSSTGSGSNSRK